MEKTLQGHQPLGEGDQGQCEVSTKCSYPAKPCHNGHGRVQLGWGRVWCCQATREGACLPIPRLGSTAWWPGGLVA